MGTAPLDSIQHSLSICCFATHPFLTQFWVQIVEVNVNSQYLCLSQHQHHIQLQIQQRSVYFSRVLSMFLCRKAKMCETLFKSSLVVWYQQIYVSVIFLSETLTDTLNEGHNNKDLKLSLFWSRFLCPCSIDHSCDDCCWITGLSLSASSD